MGFGHDKGRADLALDNGGEPAFFLFFGAALGQHIHIAFIGSGAVKNTGAEDGCIGLFIKARPSDHRQAHAAPFFGSLRRPEARSFGFAAQRLQNIEPDIVMGIPVGAVVLDGQNVVLHELACFQTQGIQFWRKGEVHDVCSLTLKNQ